MIHLLKRSAEIRRGDVDCDGLHIPPTTAARLLHELYFLGLIEEPHSDLFCSKIEIVRWIGDTLLASDNPGSARFIKLVCFASAILNQQWIVLLAIDVFRVSPARLVVELDLNERGRLTNSEATLIRSGL